MTTIPSYGAPRNRMTLLAAWVAAGMIVIMLLTQLYGFEDFASTLSSVLKSNDASLVTMLASGIVLLELLALPYLLGMYISKLLRILSALAAVVIGIFWLIVSLTSSHAENSGIFSATFELPGGVFAALWSVVLAAAIAKVIVSDSKFRQSKDS